MKPVTICFVFIFSIFFLQCEKSDSEFAAAPGNTGVGGSMARFTIVGNYLYSVDEQKLRVFSIINPSNPILRSTVTVGFEIETIYPFGDKLFIGSTSVIHIFSIDDPESPKKLSTAISPTVMRRCDPVVAKDSVAYATLRTNGPCGGFNSQLVAFDIRDITKPVQRFSTTVSEPYGLGYSDTVLYVCDKTRLLVYNISSVYDPQLIRQITGNWFMDVIAYGNTLICWVNDGVILYDITDKTLPQFIAKII